MQAVGTQESGNNDMGGGWSSGREQAHQASRLHPLSYPAVSPERLVGYLWNILFCSVIMITLLFICIIVFSQSVFFTSIRTSDRTHAKNDYAKADGKPEMFVMQRLPFRALCEGAICC